MSAPIRDATRERLFRAQALERLRGPLAADDPITLAPAWRWALVVGLVLAAMTLVVGWWLLS